MNNTTLGTAERQARAFGIALVAITTIVAGISVIVAATGVLEPSAEQIRVQKLLDARVACYNDIRRTLKDPSSLQIHNRGDDSRTIVYSATNSFGGRIRDTYYCGR